MSAPCTDPLVLELWRWQGRATAAEAALASSQEEIERLTRERDEARASWKQAVDLYEMEVARVDPALAALKQATARATATEAEVERLRKALEPFAKYMSGGMDLDNKGAPLPDDQGVGWVYLTHGDFRSAARALASKAGAA